MNLFTLPLTVLLSLSFFASCFADYRVPPALFRSCQVSGIAAACESTIRSAWQANRLQTVKGQYDFYTLGSCKVTWSCQDGNQVQLKHLDEVLAATKQLDYFCSLSDIATGATSLARGTRAVFVGRISGEYVVLQFDAV